MKSFSVGAYHISKQVKLLIYLIIIFIGIPFSGYSQSESKIDSLESLLISSLGAERIGLLDQLSEQYLKTNTARSLESAQEMLTLSKKLENNFQLQKAHLSCARSYYYLSELDSVLLYCNNSVNMQQSTKNDTVLAASYMLICNVNIIRSDYDVAMEFGTLALDTYQKIHDTLEIATTKKNLSYIFKARGEYDKAMEYVMDALTIFEESNDTMRIVSGLGTISNIYLSTGNNAQAKVYFLKAIKYLQNSKSTLIYSQVLNGLAGIYREDGQIDTSMILFQEALEIATKMNNQLMAGRITMNMANALKADCDFEKAFLLFRESKEIFTRINAIKEVNHVTYSLGETFLQAEIYDSAEIYLLKSMTLSKDINHALIYEGSLKQLYLLYEQMNNYKEAYNYHILYEQYNDSIVSENIQIKIAELETKYETSKKEQQILELEYQQQVQQSRAVTLKAIIAGVVIIFLLVIIGIWLKRKKNKQIQRQKEIVHKKEKELADAELEKSKLKEEELQQSILYKSKQLSTHALHMMQKNTMLHEMQLDVKMLSKKASIDDKPDFKRINQQINQSLRSHKDWDVFKLYFEDVNKNFYQRLMELNPELTTNDHRLCALIKLNMNSKEMASVLNVAPNSIKSSRYRLKKKLGLDVEADLEEFIRGLG